VRHPRHEIRILRLAVPWRGEAVVRRFQAERLGLLLLIAFALVLTDEGLQAWTARQL
jgi:hypothetical protein